MKIRHVGIVVSDIDIVLQFYQHWFNAVIQRDMNEQGEFISSVLGFEDIIIRTIKMNFPNSDCQLELIKFVEFNGLDRAKSLNAVGLTHIALTVDNLDVIHKKMKSDGVEFLSQPKISDDGKAKVCFCKDPENNFIELVEVV